MRCIFYHFLSSYYEAVVETVDPVVLGVRVIDPVTCRCCQCCQCDDIPESVRGTIGGTPVEQGQRQLAVSLGFFSVIRLERPEQYLVNAVEFSVPDKECSHNDDDTPCDAFNRMAFPIDEFSPGRVRADSGFGCGCQSETIRGLGAQTAQGSSPTTRDDGGCSCRQR